MKIDEIQLKLSQTVEDASKEAVMIKKNNFKDICILVSIEVILQRPPINNKPSNFFCYPPGVKVLDPLT